MADAAARRMTVEEFLAWDDGTDTRYELIDGQPVAKAPNMSPHGRMVGRLAGAIEAALRSRPGCGVWLNTGVRAARSDSYFIPDLIASCEPISNTQRELMAPILIVECLSESTEQVDRSIKLPDYQLLQGLQEILLIDPRRIHAEVHRRIGVDQWLVHLLRSRESRLTLESVGLDMALGDLYECLPID